MLLVSAVLGFWWGFLVATIGTAVGMLLAFLVGKQIFHDRLHRCATFDKFSGCLFKVMFGTWYRIILVWTNRLMMFLPKRRWVQGNHKAEAMLLAISEAGPFKVWLSMTVACLWGCLCFCPLLCLSTDKSTEGSHRPQQLMSVSCSHTSLLHMTCECHLHAGCASHAPSCPIHMAELRSFCSSRGYLALVHAGFNHWTDSAQCSRRLLRRKCHWPWGSAGVSTKSPCYFV